MERNKMNDISTLSAEWLELKEAERLATERRREVEDTLLSRIGIPEALDGTETVTTPEGFQIKIVGRMNRKIDAELVQELAAENGLTEHLSTLLRWKPEVNQSAWKAANESITRALSGAITTTPGRPSFSISTKEGK
jgi:hypothetical protein